MLIYLQPDPQTLWQTQPANQQCVRRKTHSQALIGTHSTTAPCSHTTATLPALSLWSDCFKTNIKHDAVGRILYYVAIETDACIEVMVLVLRWLRRLNVLLRLIRFRKLRNYAVSGRMREWRKTVNCSGQQW